MFCQDDKQRVQFNGIERDDRLLPQAKFRNWNFYQLIVLLASPLKIKLNGETISLEGFGKINPIEGKFYVIQNGKLGACWVL